MIGIMFKPINEHANTAKYTFYLKAKRANTIDATLSKAIMII